MLCGCEMWRINIKRNRTFGHVQLLTVGGIMAIQLKDIKKTVGYISTVIAKLKEIGLSHNIDGGYFLPNAS